MRASTIPLMLQLMHMKLPRNTSFIKVLVVGIVALATVLSVVPWPQVNAANNNSNMLTNSANFSAGGKAGYVDLHLKNLGVAKVLVNKMGAYYPASDISTNNKAIKILPSANGRRVCNIVGTAKKGNLEVIIKINGNSKTYRIPKDKVCPSNSSRFYGHVFDFPTGALLPGGDANPDFNSANIDIGFESGDESLRQPDGNDLNYRVQLMRKKNNGEYIQDSNGIVALLGTADLKESGLRSAYSGAKDDAANKNVKAVIPFGYPCNVDPASNARLRRVMLYDADVGFGATYMWITKGQGGGTPLNRSDYDTTQNKNIGSWDNTNKRWLLQASGGSSNVLVMKDTAAEKNASYKLHILNTGAGGTISPHNNTLSVSIPFDSIYSDVDCSFGLRPYTSVSPDVYTAQSRLDVHAWLGNVGTNEATGSHAWQIYEVKYSSNPSRNIASTHPNSPCSTPPSTDMIPGSCRLYYVPRPYNKDTDVTQSYQTTSDPIGTYTCFFTRVNQPRDTSPAAAWRYSNLACAVSGLQPKVQVWGGDVRVGGEINTSATELPNKTYGSWGEYGALSNGVNSGFASGKGLMGGGTNDQANWSDLTFANLDGFGSYGGIAPVNPAYVADETRNDGYHFAQNSTQTFTDKRVIRVNGTAFIDHNLEYGGSYASISQIPSIKIIADDFVIAPGVTRIDPWLIATTEERGRISTCSTLRDADGGYFVSMENANLHSGMCDKQLVFNGPVIANQIYLYRTYNQVPSDPEEPAEKFNLRSDVYLSSFSGNTTIPVATTDLITELPPRF